MKVTTNKNVFFISLGFFWVFLGFSAAQQYLVPLLKLQGRQNLALISLLILYLTFLLSGFVISKFIAMFGLKKSLLIGAVTYGLFSIGAISNNTAFFLFTSFLIGWGGAMLWVSGAQIISDSTSKNFIGQSIGLQSAMIALGGAIGTAAGGFLVHMFSFEIVYMFFAVSSFIGIVFFIQVKTTRGYVSTKKIHIHYIFNRKILLLFPLIFSSYFLSGTTFTAMNLLLLGMFSLSQIGILASMLRFTTIVNSFLSGKITDMYKKENVIYASAVIGIIGTTIFLTSKNYWFLLFGAILLGIFISTTHPLCIAFLKEMFSHEEYEHVLGVYYALTTLGSLGAIFSSLLFSPNISFFIGIFSLFFIFPATYFLSQHVASTNEFQYN